jgi:hypothetical protein
LVPRLDLLGAVVRPIFLHPIGNLLVGTQLIGDLLERVRVNVKKLQEMLVEAEGLVVVAAEFSASVETRLVDETR